MALFALSFFLAAAMLCHPFGTLRGPSETSGTTVNGPAFSTSNQLTALQFLLISSPSDKKVVWTTLQNMQSQEGHPLALISTGLETPKGLAFDRKGGFLYIADTGARKIFRYTLLIDTTGETPKLTTTSVRLTIVQGQAVEWVTVDEKGTLFYSNLDTNNINKISAVVMSKIGSGEFSPLDLTIVSEKMLEAKSSAASVVALSSIGSTQPVGKVDPPPIVPHIYSVYEANINPHVSKPSSVLADGTALYWTNAAGGTTAGTVVQGEISPAVDKNATSASGPAPFPTTVLTTVSNAAVGLAKTDKMLFFTREGATPDQQIVSGMLLGTNIIMDFAGNLASPKGIVWDRDETMYVADAYNGEVSSFPSGRMMKNAPLTLAVTMPGAYGLAILSSRDECFNAHKVNVNGGVEQIVTADAEDGVSLEQEFETGSASLVQIDTRPHKFLKSYSHKGHAFSFILVLIGAMALTGCFEM